MKINVVNPTTRRYSRHSYLFWFGNVGSTVVLTYADSWEDALEDAAEWLLEEGLFGHITPHEKAGDLDCDCLSENPECESHTITESGFLTSYEFTGREDVSKMELIEIHRSSY
jgi:hypothetical protein